MTRPDPYLNALRLIERFGHDLAIQYAASGMTPEAKAGASMAIGAMVNATELHRALLESANARIH